MSGTRHRAGDRDSRSLEGKANAKTVSPDCPGPGRAAKRSQVASGFLHCVLHGPVLGAGANFFLV